MDLNSFYTGLKEAKMAFDNGTSVVMSVVAHVFLVSEEKTWRSHRILSYITFASDPARAEF